MFTATIALSAINGHWVKKILQEKNEEYAQLLIENLNHQVFMQFIVPVVLKYGQVRLREREQFNRMEQVVKSTLHSFNVELVNIYDLNNVISYSYDKGKIGKSKAGGEAYQKAVDNESSSYLEREGSRLELLFGIPRRTKIITFAPLRAEKPLSAISGPVLGVVEIVQDVTQDYRNIFKLQLAIILSCALVMGSLFFVLRFVVKQGEIIIEKRAEERLRLEEKLQRAEHLSAIGEMTAGVSHEIRNPLGIIKSSAELLKKKLIRLGESSAIIDIILEEAIRLNNIIRDFLDFARPMTPDLKSCRIQDILEKNVHYISTQAEQQEVRIDDRIPQNLPPVMADANLLYQAFLNVMLNAVQAMPEGGTISIRASRAPSIIFVSIADEGDGIDPDHLNKIWTPFYTTKDMGTGLGLGIVKNIIESHGGKITIAAVEDAEGTRVDITLPIAEETPDEKSTHR